MSTPTPLPKVGKYQLLSRLGAGGMAEVFEAQTETGEKVAIKTIRASLRSDPQFVEMFLNEARIAALLQHPHVVRVNEVGQINGIPFIAMERVNGEVLSELLARQQPARTPPAVAARLMAGVASALHHAHAVATTVTGEKLQVVHRDVSPQNIMVADDGRVLLLDFGVAKAQGAPGFLQSSGDLLKGKVRYMAPELVESGTVSPLTDVFAAGAILFELIAGEPLYPMVESADLLIQVASAQHRELKELAPECPPKLLELIDWAIQKDPAKRCPSAAAWIEGLEAFIATLPLAAGQAGVAAWAHGVAQPRPRPLVEENEKEEVTSRASEAETHLRERTRMPPPVAEETAVVARLPVMRPRESNSRLTALGLTFLTVLVVGIGVGELDPSPTVVVQAPRPSGPPARAPFVLYLDGAEAALMDGRYDSARETLELARKLGSDDARLALRLVELTSRMNREGGALRVRALIKMGDLDGAQAQLHYLVEHDPDPAVIEQLAKELQAHRPAGVAATPALTSTSAPTAPATPVPPVPAPGASLPTVTPAPAHTGAAEAPVLAKAES